MTIQELIKTLEIQSKPETACFLQSRNYQEATSNLGILQKVVEKQRRILAQKYHPDKKGNHEKMAEINNAADLFEKIKIIPPQPQPVVYRFVFGGQMPSGWRDVSGTDSTPTSTGGW